MPLSPAGMTSGFQKLKTLAPPFRVTVIPEIVTALAPVFWMRTAPASKVSGPDCDTTPESPSQGVGKNPLGRRLSAYPTKTLRAARASVTPKHVARDMAASAVVHKYFVIIDPNVRRPKSGSTITC